MNAQMLALLIEKNSADIEAIVNKIGVPTLLALIPHFTAILETVQAAQKKP